jgi:hypothetical protein
VLTGVFGYYVYQVLVRTDVEVLRTWHVNKPVRLLASLRRADRRRASTAFPLRNGWKAVGAAYARGELDGKFRTNALAYVAEWYLAGQGVCPRNDRYFALASTVETTDDGYQDALRREISQEYSPLASVVVNGQPRLEFFSRDAQGEPVQWDDAAAAQVFDAQLATPQRGGYRGRVLTAAPAQTTDFRLGDDQIQLAGYTLDRPVAAPGEEIEVTLYWRALAPIYQPYTVFTQLIDPATNGKIGQLDGQPVCDWFPTEQWNPGDLIADPYRIAIAPDAAPGEYQLLVGMYDATTGQRLPVAAADGARIGRCDPTSRDHGRTMNRQQGMAALAAAATGLAGAAIIVSAQVWAFHYLVHVPLAARWLFALFVAAVGVAAVWLAPRIDWLGRAWDVTRWPAWLMAGVGGATFLLFAERTHYGDGLLKLKLLATATLQDRPPYIWKAPLEGLAGYAASQTAGAVGLPLAAGIVALSVSAGIIYLLAARSIAGSLSPIPGRRLLVFVGLLALGTSQLWFGHIENYSMVTAFVAVTMALALRFLAQPGDRFDAEAQRCRDAQGGDDESSALPASANLPASAPLRQTEPAKRLPSEGTIGAGRAGGGRGGGLSPAGALCYAGAAAAGAAGGPPARPGRPGNHRRRRSAADGGHTAAVGHAAADAGERLRWRHAAFLDVGAVQRPAAAGRGLGESLAAGSVGAAAGGDRGAGGWEGRGARGEGGGARGEGRGAQSAALPVWRGCRAVVLPVCLSE